MIDRYEVVVDFLAFSFSPAIAISTLDDGMTAGSVSFEEVEELKFKPKVQEMVRLERNFMLHSNPVARI